VSDYAIPPIVTPTKQGKHAMNRQIFALSALSIVIASSFNLAQMQPSQAQSLPVRTPNKQALRPIVRPDLNGQLLVLQQSRLGLTFTEFFWVDQGLARPLPFSGSLNPLGQQLFRSGRDANPTVNPTTVQPGAPLPSDAILAQCNQANHPLRNTTFLIDRAKFRIQVKRPIPSQVAFDKHQFNPNAIQTVSCEFLNQFPTNAAIQ
jgi:hypothetical protein